MRGPAGEAFEGSLRHGPAPRAAMIELVAFLALVLSYIWLWSNAIPYGWIWIGVLGLGLTIGTHLLHGERPRDLGFRLDTFGAAARAAALPMIPIVGLLIGIGAFNGRLNEEFLSPGRWVDLIAWASLQQYLLQSFIHRRVAALVGSPLLRELAVGGIFAILHLPNPLLFLITFAAGYLFARLFRRAANIYVLALCHAVGSSAVYFGLDPQTLHGMRVGPGFHRF